MTQASLSPDLHGAVGAPPSVHDSGRPGATLDAAVWVIALTSSALVVASVLLLGLIGRNVITDASLGGFVSGVAIVVAAIGMGGVGYALVTARRAGLLDSASSPALEDVVPAGMHVVPAAPPDLSRRKRRQLEAERAERSKQATAIATAAAAATFTVAPKARAVTTAPKPHPVAPPSRAPRPMASPRSAPRPPQRRVVHPAVVQGARPTPGPAARPTPFRPAPVRMAPALNKSVTAPPAKARPGLLPPITMPRPQMRQPRPAAWPNRAPVVRIATTPMRPRTQVATFQVNAANARPTVPVRRR